MQICRLTTSPIYAKTLAAPTPSLIPSGLCFKFSEVCTEQRAKEVHERDHGPHAQAAMAPNVSLRLHSNTLVGKKGLPAQPAFRLSGLHHFESVLISTGAGQFFLAVLHRKQVPFVLVDSRTELISTVISFPATTRHIRNRIASITLSIPDSQYSRLLIYIVTASRAVLSIYCTEFSSSKETGGNTVGND